MKTLFSSVYFGSIEYYTHWLQAEEPMVEIHENFQKQTYRSRCYINGANGLLGLNIPVYHAEGGAGRQKMADVRTVNEFRWAREHFRSLATAYRTSPFFEYYEDIIAEFYDSENDSLLELNLASHRIVCRLLGISATIIPTQSYQDTPEDTLDLRRSITAKTRSELCFEPYTQVFESKHGFVPDLSVLDLIFCMGPQAKFYLENVNISK